MFRRACFFLIMGVFLILTGCDDKPVEIKAQVRAIKTFTVSEDTGGDVRKFPGQIFAANSASMSFPTSGTVKEILVSTGDRVVYDQILATQDEVPFQLEVDAAEAELRKVESTANEKKGDYNRNKQLHEKGWVSEAALEQAQFAMNTALEEVNYKSTRVHQAKRSLNDATLRAPFAGTVGEQFVEPNEEVAGGGAVLALDSDGAFEVSISVPEKLISKLSMGMPANVTFSVLSDVNVEGHVTEISRIAGAGNIFPVKVTLVNSPVELRSGMSGEVALTTEDSNQGSGFLIPLSAVSAGENLEGSYVFIFDKASSTIKKIKIESGTPGESLINVQGVKPGDLIVSAGVSFLSDGQEVKLMNPVAQN